MSSAPVNEESPQKVNEDPQVFEESPQKVNEDPQVFEEDSDFDDENYDYTDLVHKEVN